LFDLVVTKLSGKWYISIELLKSTRPIFIGKKYESRVIEICGYAIYGFPMCDRRHGQGEEAKKIIQIVGCHISLPLQPK